VFAVFLELTDTFIVNVAFPAMASQLHVSLTDLDWVVNSYMLSIALVVPLSAYLGDRFGTKRIFLIAIGLFTISSLLCASSTTLTELIIARSLQGMGAGMLVPVGQAMVFRAFPKQELIKIMSIISVPILVAPALSQVLGGLIVEYLSWRWIFLVNLPIGLFCFFTAYKYLIENKSQTMGRFDFLGFVLSASGFVLLFYALSKFAFNQPLLLPILLVFVSIFVLIVFSLRSMKIQNPFLDVKVFDNAHFRLSIICFVLMSSCMGSFVIYNFFTQETLKFSPFAAGFLSVPFSVGMLLITKSLHKYYARYGALRLFIIGTMLYIVGTAAMVFIHDSSQYGLLVLLYFIRGLGQGFLGLILQTVSLQTMPEKDMGHASAILSMSWYISVSLGVAFFTLFISSLATYHGIIPVNFASAQHKFDIVYIFRLVDILSAAMYVVGLLFFFKIKHKKQEPQMVGATEEGVQ
jgi:EmrB/QacA subfamily drug resistance transporter